MSDPNQTFAEINPDEQQRKFFAKKELVLLLLVVIVVTTVLAFFYISRQQSKPISLEPLDQYQQDQTLRDANDLSFPFSEISGYELTCQIFLDELVYPNRVFDNFIIQAAAPCWFYDQDNQPSAVNIPIVIEDTLSQRWTNIGASAFRPTYTGQRKDQAIRGVSHFIFVAESDSPSPELFEAVVVRLNFAKQTPYQDYYEAAYLLDGEYIPKDEFYSERLLLQLASQQQNQEAIGVAETLSKAKNTSIEGLVQSGILESRAGKVRLLKRKELDGNWSPEKHSRLTAWKITQQLIQSLDSDGEQAAAELILRIGSEAEIARDLAYRLFSVCERKGWAQDALVYNMLVVAWPRLKDLVSKISPHTQTSFL